MTPDKHNESPQSDAVSETVKESADELAPVAEQGDAAGAEAESGSTPTEVAAVEADTEASGTVMTEAALDDTAPAAAEQPMQATAPAVVQETGQAAAADSAGANQTPTPEAAPTDELGQLEQALVSSGHKHTEGLRLLGNRLSRMAQRMAQTVQADVAASERLANLRQTLEELQEKNQQYQAQLQQSTHDLLANLKQSMNSGEAHAALPTWDKIQTNIDNTSGEIRKLLQEQIRPFRNQLNDLRNWKLYAATEKKQELVERMRQLPGEGLKPQALSRRISKLHQEWKALGRSMENDVLWTQFKALSDQAYEPCKEYFRQRKETMAANLKARRELCEQLEQRLAEIGDQAEDLPALGKLLSESEKIWKQHAPVEQSKIKPLQKRYYEVLNKLRELRRGPQQENAAAKQRLVSQAEQLVGQEDNRQAREEAKRLQQDWKQIGPSTHKEDRKLWERFRAACDAIFEQRKQAASELQSTLQEAETKLEEILKALAAMLKLDDEALRAARSDYKDHLQAFSAALHPKLRKSRAKFNDRLNTLRRQLDGRFRALPDKKELALLQAVNARADWLLELEQRLFAGDGNFTAILGSVDMDQWQQLAAVPHPELGKALEQRLQALQACSDSKDLEQLANKEAERLHELCIEAEIRANIDSPESDRQRRMAMQLAQLQDGFGQQRPSAKDNLRYARELELQLQCSGPLLADQRQQLLPRLQAAASRLRQ